MRKTKKVAVIAASILIYSSFAAMAAAEETNNNDTTLDEVVVTGSKLNPTKFSVVTEAEIKAKGAQNVAEALKDVAGLYVTGSNTKGKKIAQFRGSDAGNTKIFIDGVPLSPVGDGKVDLSNIPAENIAKIEIIKGAVPVIYGTDAPGGVIFITTKNGSNKSSGSVSIARGSWGTDTYSATLGGDAGKINYFLSIKKENTDGYTSHSSGENDYYNGKIRWDINPKSSLTVFGSYSESEKQIPNRYDANGNLIVNRGQGGAVAAYNSFFSNSKNWEYDPLKQSYIGALYTQKLNNNNDLSFKVYHSNEKSTLITSSPRDYWDGTVTGYELQHTSKTSRANTITWGYAYETRSFTELATNNIVSRPESNRADYDYTGKSFYIQDVTNINRKLTTSFGYRHNENKDHMTINAAAFAATQAKLPGIDIYHPSGADTSDNPVVSFNYAMNDKTAIHGSIGKSYRFPNAKERAGLGGLYSGVNGDYSLGRSTYLLPEEVINREVGLKHDFSSRLGFDITYFNKDIKNMIKGQGQGEGHTQYENIPDVDMHGFELEVHQKFSKQIKGFVNYSYTNALDTWQNRQVSDIPYRKFSYGVNYAGNDGMNVNLAVNYVGAVKSAFSNGNGNGNEDGWKTPFLLQKLSSYHVVDLKVSKSINNKEYYVKILNLLDKQYYLGAYLIAP
ncbi:TonB-dependent receptor, partial [Sporomusa ovata]